MTTTTAGSTPAARERTRREATVRAAYETLAGSFILADHPVQWGPHPVPWCGGPCPGGETWPCPPVRAELAARGIGVAL